MLMYCAGARGWTRTGHGVVVEGAGRGGEGRNHRVSEWRMHKRRGGREKRKEQRQM